jgi:DNA-binding response OmpR family regulator
MSSLLIAEDDDHLAALMVRALTKPGHRVDRVRDGAAAIRAHSSVGYDLVILDVGLPGATGLEVLTHLRRQEPGLPVLLVTADNEPAHVVRGLKAGADDYITKPFAFDELVARIETRLRSIRTAETVLSCGALTLDLVSRTVSGPRGLVDLPSREFALLEYFMRRPDQVLSRDQLLHEVWGYGSETSSNVVDVYVRYLRQKTSTTVIRSVRGVGYTMPG